MKLFEAIDVWKRVSENELIRYRCFKNLQTRKYSVQSSDFYRFPLDLNRSSFLEKQYLELLASDAPDERNAGFETLSEAIEAHDREFRQC
jgi:hypothetical protein